MKKITALILTLALCAGACFALSACGKEEAPAAKEETKTEEIEA